MCVAHGCNNHGQCKIPPLDAGLAYTQVSAGWAHTVLLRSDGKAVAFGWNEGGQCNIPALDGGLSYVLVSAGFAQTVLLRSDGKAVACGDYLIEDGVRRLPALARGVTYTEIAAGWTPAVLLKCDGTVDSLGDRDSCAFWQLPPLDAGVTYIQSRQSRLLPALVLQASFVGTSICFITLGGQQLCQIEAATTAAEVRTRLLHEIGLTYSRVDIVLPGGDLMPQ